MDHHSHLQYANLSFLFILINVIMNAYMLLTFTANLQLKLGKIAGTHNINITYVKSVYGDYYNE